MKRRKLDTCISTPVYIERDDHELELEAHGEVEPGSIHSVQGLTLWLGGEEWIGELTQGERDYAEQKLIDAFVERAADEADADACAAEDAWDAEREARRMGL